MWELGPLSVSGSAIHFFERSWYFPKLWIQLLLTKDKNDDLVLSAYFIHKRILPWIEFQELWSFIPLPQLPSHVFLALSRGWYRLQERLRLINNETKNLDLHFPSPFSLQDSCLNWKKRVLLYCTCRVPGCKIAGRIFQCSSLLIP